MSLNKNPGNGGGHVAGWQADTEDPGLPGGMRERCDRAACGASRAMELLYIIF